MTNYNSLEFFKNMPQRRHVYLVYFLAFGELHSEISLQRKGIKLKILRSCPTAEIKLTVRLYVKDIYYYDINNNVNKID